MDESTRANFEELAQTIQSNRALKTAIYIGIGILTLYALGKACKGLAETVRGFNDLKSAINGH